MKCGSRMDSTVVTRKNTGNAEWRRANGRNKKRKLGINEKHD